MKRILIVDDSSVSLSLAKSMLSDKYNISAVVSGEQALRFLEKKTVDLVLLDINMPEMSGYETLKAIKELPACRDLPIIFLTSDTDPETERKCFELGAYDFIVKPFQKATLRSRVGRTLDLLDLQLHLEEQLLEKTREIAKLSLKSMTIIANTVDKKDPLASHHSTNVAWFAIEIAKKLGWSQDDIYNLHNLALLHDIGNIGVSDAIIRKKGPLTDDEYSSLKKHTTMGKTILQDMTVIRKAAEVAETHHERYDGHGYPYGLTGENIPIESRIIAIADAFDAMTSDRSYRVKLSKDELLSEFTKGRGTQFDPYITDIAIDLIKEQGLGPSDVELDTSEDLVTESSRLLQKVLQEYTKEIRSEASKDSLTGLWNRTYTADFLDDYLRDKRNSGCLFMVDIDGFKQINDTFGHIAGDHLIQQVGQALKMMVRSDDIICRIGGDEFIIFTKGNAERRFAASKAEDIILYLDKNLETPDKQAHISISVGIALAPFDGTDFATLYNKADKALYLVKKNGKHSYQFFSEDLRPMSHKITSTRIDLEYLHRFIQEKDVSPGAFQVGYDGFKKIYRFLARAQKRATRPIILLLFTVTDLNGDTPDGDTLAGALSHLKDAITTSIRSGDVATNYSSSQYLTILVDSSPSNGYLVAERIRKIFYEHTEGLKVKLTYDLDSNPFDNIANDDSDE